MKTYTVTIQTRRGGYRRLVLDARSARTARMKVTRALLPGERVHRVR